MSLATTGVNFYGIMLSEISQKQRQILYNIINFMWNLKKKKKPNKLVNIMKETPDTKNKLVVSSGEGESRGGAAQGLEGRVQNCWV